MIAIYVNGAYNHYTRGYNFPIPQKDKGPRPGRNYREMDAFMFGRKVVFGLKMGFNPKTSQNDILGDNHLGKSNFFL